MRNCTYSRYLYVGYQSVQTTTTTTRSGKYVGAMRYGTYLRRTYVLFGRTPTGGGQEETAPQRACHRGIIP